MARKPIKKIQKRGTLATVDPNATITVSNSTNPTEFRPTYNTTGAKKKKISKRGKTAVVQLPGEVNTVRKGKTGS